MRIYWDARDDGGDTIEPTARDHLVVIDQLTALGEEVVPATVTAAALAYRAADRAEQTAGINPEQLARSEVDKLISACREGGYTDTELDKAARTAVTARDAATAATGLARTTTKTLAAEVTETLHAERGTILTAMDSHLRGWHQRLAEVAQLVPTDLTDRDRRFAAADIAAGWDALGTVVSLVDLTQTVDQLAPLPQEETGGWLINALADPLKYCTTVEAGLATVGTYAFNADTDRRTALLTVLQRGATIRYRSNEQCAVLLAGDIEGLPARSRERIARAKQLDDISRFTIAA